VGGQRSAVGSLDCGPSLVVTEFGEMVAGDRALRWGAGVFVLVVVVVVSVVRAGRPGGVGGDGGGVSQGLVVAVAERSASEVGVVRGGAVAGLGEGDEGRWGMGKLVGVPGRQAAPDPRIALLLQETLAGLRGARAADDAAVWLRRLREGLWGGEEAAAAAAVSRFLEGGDDVATGLPFLVGQDGMLEVAPTMRAALLDLLPSLDPLLAEEVSRQVMERGASADEYALGLRNLAWNDLEGDRREEVSERFVAMLGRDGWLAAPTDGFLEAFDVPVAVGGARLFAELAGLIALEDQRGERLGNGVGRAAFVALDRMLVRSPGLIAAQLAAEPDFLSYAPQYRAALVSRLDITEPGQRRAFVSYLKRGGHGEGELGYFAELFPNGNSFHGHRLVSVEEEVPTMEERREMDRRVLVEVEAAMAELGEGVGRVALGRIAERLRDFVGEEG